MATPPEKTLSSPYEGSPGGSPGTISPDASHESPSSPSDEDATGTPRLPGLRSVSTPPNPSMTASSTHLGLLNNARRPNAPSAHMSSVRGVPPPGPRGGLSESMEAKMKAFHLSRQGTPPIRTVGVASSSTDLTLENSSSGTSASPSPIQSKTPSPGETPSMPGFPGGMRLPTNLRPPHQTFVSAPAVPKVKKGGLSERRGMKLPGGLPGLPGNEASTGSSSNPGSDGGSQPNGGTHTGSMFTQFSKYVDTKNGTLNFAGKAVIHGQGIDFTGGNNFSISLDEVDTLEELGKGNYGTVYKVRHARPRIRRPGLGLAGNKSGPMTPSPEKETELEPLPKGSSTTNVVMAMKEIHLELDEAKFSAIIMELDVLHRCVSPYIIDFYGAFFQEGAVYICIEFMDGGSIDKLYGDGIPENILRKITYATTQGLKTLKDEHNIIHRDVKPTNILINTRGQIKICDFGVSGNLVASIAKTNIGCQSYMAPERISGGGIAAAGANPGGGTYSAQSDIWSLGLSIIECAMGRYPYPPETYNNIFSQLSVSLPFLILGCKYLFEIGNRRWRASGSP